MKPIDFYANMYYCQGMPNGLSTDRLVNELIFTRHRP
jgi:hypothetical protein